MRAFFLRNGEEFQVLYATPDEEATIAGVMWDADGKNLTRSQTAKIEGVTPSAFIGNVNDNPAALTPGGALDAVQNTVFGTLGDNAAPRLWVFIDPLCSYSVRALNELMPVVKQHRLQLAIIPISLLDYEDQNHSTAATLSLLSKSPDEIVKAWMARDYSGSNGAEAEARLKKNMSVGHAIGVKGTPTFLWKGPDGSEGRLDGLPEDWKPVLAAIEGGNHAIDAK
jgi:thiol:disulfide interchange protein DsbG